MIQHVNHNYLILCERESFKNEIIISQVKNIKSIQ